MAHKRSSKKTSFGKKSDSEKSFIKRGRKKEDSDDKPKRSFGRSSNASSARSRDEESSFSKRPGRKSFDSDEKPKRSFRPSAGAPSIRPKRSEDDRFSKRDERKSDSEFKPKRSFSKPAGSDWTKRGEEKGSRFDKKDFTKSTPSGERPFSKLPSFSKRPADKTSSGDREKGGELKSEKLSSLGFTKKGKTTAKTQPSYEGTDAGLKKEEALTRLNKHIANSGMGSRREADEMIKKGLISVNGTTITEMGFKVKPGDVVRYEDKVLKAEKPVYVLLNKPKGFITTTADPKDRKTVMNLVANACKERLYPVGRLDRNTTGLLLLTNDGALAEKLTHPSYNTKKIYKVELDKPLTKNDFQKIQDGVHLEEGRAIVDDIAIASDDKKTIGIELHIGWNRVVRRIFESLDYEVVKLDRVIFAGLDKKDLPRGEWRFLKPEEVVRLKHFK